MLERLKLYMVYWSARLAQLVERTAFNRMVVGSSPTVGTLLSEIQTAIPQKFQFYERGAALINCSKHEFRNRSISLVGRA